MCILYATYIQQVLLIIGAMMTTPTLVQYEHESWFLNKVVVYTLDAVFDSIDGR